MDLAQYALTDTEIEFLSQKEKNSNLVYEISSEFTNDADQITITPASGKRFFLVGLKLYPVTDTVSSSAPTGTTTTSRRADVELTFDGTVKDVLTHDFRITQGTNSSGATAAQGAGGQAGQYTGLAKGISMSGNGVKAIKLTSTNTSGTYRVSILGYYEDE